MASSLLSSTSEVRIPLELFVALVVVGITGILSYFAWLTKQVVTLSQIISTLNTEIINMKADIDMLFRSQPSR